MTMNPSSSSSSSRGTDCCANCTLFLKPDERIRRIRYLSEKDRLLDFDFDVGHEDSSSPGEQGQQLLKVISASSEEGDEGDLSTVGYTPSAGAVDEVSVGDDGTAILTSSSTQELMDMNDMSVPGNSIQLSVVTLTPLTHGSFEVGGQQFQMNPEEAQQLINSGVEIVIGGSDLEASLIVDGDDDERGKSLLGVLDTSSIQLDEIQGDSPEPLPTGSTSSVSGSDSPSIFMAAATATVEMKKGPTYGPELESSREETCVVEGSVGKKDSVTVLEALTTIFCLPFGNSIGKDKNPCVLCAKCAKVVTILYSTFEDLNSLTQENSYIAKAIKQFSQSKSGLGVGNLRAVTQSSSALWDKKKREAKRRIVHRVVRTDASICRSRPGKKHDIDSDEEVDSDFDLVTGDLLSEDSSDSNSLSDLEVEVNTEPVRTRASTRPRATKKPSSDYEEMESAEDDENETFEDNEEDDPNFDAAEELQDIKVSLEYVKLHRLSTLCVNAFEYKLGDVKVDSEGKFACPECNKTFKSLKTLNKHAVIHQLEKFPHKCPRPQCQQQFETLDQLEEHVRMLHPPPSSSSSSFNKRITRRSPVRAVTKVKREKTTPGRSTVKRHKRFACATCRREFYSRTALNIHAEDEHNDANIVARDPAVCPTCSKQFSTSFVLQRHQKNVHEKQTVIYFCPECGEIFNTLDTLSSHFVASHKAPLNFCSHCGKSFLALKYLLLHLQDMHMLSPDEISDFEKTQQESENQFKLSQVNETMEEDNDRSDELLEPGERRKKADPTPYKCSLCDKDFRRKKQLEIHLLFHKGEEPQHACTFCAKRFFQMKTLKRHIGQHTSENSHVCNICDRLFPRADHLKRHMESAHSDESSRYKMRRDLRGELAEHKCSDCDKSFTRREYLRLHQRIHTGEKPFMCSVCGKTFRDPRNLAQHLVTHKSDRPFCCSICGLTFKRAHHLHDHEGTHREDVVRPFVCTSPNCGKAFKLRKHLISHELVHSGTKDHQCDFCGKAFNRKDNLRQHINKVHSKDKDSFADLIRVPTELHLAPGQQVQIQLQGSGHTLVPVTAITSNGNNAPTITTIQIPPQVLQALPTAHFTYTHL